MSKQANIISEMIKRMDKSVRDAREGKLYYGTHGWVYGTVPYVNPQGVVLQPRQDSTGNFITLKKASFVTNCPKPPVPERYVKTTNGVYNVPAGICRKCPHRLTNRRCAIWQDLNKDRSLLNDFAELMEDAKRKIEETL